MDFPRDPNDAKFLAWAIARDADFLITGDRDLNQIREVRQTTIISYGNAPIISMVFSWWSSPLKYL